MKEFGGSFQSGEPLQTPLDGIRESVRRFPKRIAVTGGGNPIPFEDLDAGSDCIARYLLKGGIRKGDRVGVWMRRNERAVEAILSVLKAGAVYVPLDPIHPPERTRFLLEDSGCVALLHDDSLDFTVEGRKVLRVEEADRTIGGVELPRLGPEDPFYILYTSGSTGKPKGCPLTYGNVVQVLTNGLPLFSFGPEDAWLLINSFCFDVSIWELFGSLMTGGKLVVAGNETRYDFVALLELFEKEGVSVLNLAPQPFLAFSAEAKRRGVDLSASLRKVLFAGEKLDFRKLKDWAPVLREGKIEFYNVYGITECSIYSTAHRITAEDILENGSESNIGQCFPGTEAVIYTESLVSAAVGEVGELVLAGEGICGGYLNRSEQTREKFLPHPRDPSQRLYRTGDLVYQKPNGDLIFIGRNDDQIHFHGHRIEPGELESAIDGYPGVQQSLVLLHRDREDQQQLVAFVQLKKGTDFSLPEVRRYLRGQLPFFSIPGRWEILERFPLSPNGKIDRKRLQTKLEGDGGEAGREQPITANPANLFSGSTVQLEDGSIVERFRKRVRENGDAIAVRSGNRGWSYRDLEAWSDGVADRIRAAGQAPGSHIGITMPRSAELVVGMLGILKVGGVYVPLDPRDPESRRLHIVEDAEIGLILTQPGHRVGSIPVLEILPDPEEGEGISDRERRLDLPGSEAPAYLIYTSGSTGLPKGCRIPHQAVLRLVEDRFFADYKDEERILFHSSPAFDAATFEIWCTLLNGLTLVILEGSRIELEAFRDVVTRERPTLCFLTTGFFNLLVDEAPELFGGFRRVLTGGEAISVAHVERLRRKHPSLELVHVYGPTENTTFSTAFSVTAEAIASGCIPIGVPIAGTQALVVKDDGSSAEPGEAGELLLGGLGLAVDYWKQDRLTRDRFPSIKIERQGPVRFYRSGDRVRVLKGGSLEFLGREDDQVKIRGFRVELQEIEALLNASPEIATSIVRYTGPSGSAAKYLVGYVIPAAGSISPPALEEYLKARLPDYMIPRRWVSLEAFPLNSQGKVDRKGLPDPDFKGSDENPDRPLPRLADETEALVTELWLELLPVETIHPEDDFFALGGNSLSAIQLLSRLQSRTGETLSLNELFYQPTVRQLAVRLNSRKHANAYRSLVPLKDSGSRKPLYFVHGWGGEVFVFLELARQLGEDQPVFGLQAVEFSGDQERFGSIEEAARHYVEEVIRFQPEGPYSLSGFSLGGMIAYEMARQLMEQGREVRFLGIIDTYPRNLPKMVQIGSLFPYLASRLEYHGKQLIHGENNGLLRYLKNRAKAFRNLVTGSAEIIRDDPAAAEAVPEAPSASTDHYQILYNQYVPRPCPVRVELFRASENRFGLPMAWNYLARNGVQVSPLSGGHMDFFEEEKQAEFARQFRERLEAGG